jgi:hypothetical protein
MLKAFLDVFNSILGSIREPLIVLGPDLKVVTANNSFYATFSVKPDETEGVLIYDLGNRQWNIPKLRELLENILPENARFNDFKVEHIFEAIGCKIMHLNARRIYSGCDQNYLILLAIEDVTEREYYKKHFKEPVEKQKAEQEAFIKSTEVLRHTIYEKELCLKAELVKKAPDIAKALSSQNSISEARGKLEQKMIEHLIQMKNINLEAETK